MKAVMICAALLVASLVFTNESQAQNFYGGGFNPAFGNYGYGYAQSWYVPVPPYYALHPPVYYSHEIVRRPVGDSPYAYQSRRPAAEPRRQLSMNPFVPDAVNGEGSPQAAQANDSTAQVMRNPFYGDDPASLADSKLILNPYYAKPAAVVAQASDR